MTTEPGDYYWSSYQSHAFGKRVQLWTPHMEYLALGETEADRTEQYRALVSQILSADVVQKIRHCVNTGLVLRTERFRDQVKALRS